MGPHLNGSDSRQGSGALSRLAVGPCLGSGVLPWQWGLALVVVEPFIKLIPQTVPALRGSDGVGREGLRRVWRPVRGTASARTL